MSHQYAIYYIGVDDDGSIVGLDDDEAFECIKRFVSIAESIKASLSMLTI